MATTPAGPATPTHSDWVPLLRELADQFDAGRSYARDLPALAAALTDVLVPPTTGAPRPAPDAADS
ncbi:MAG: hypothetical protein M3Z50_09960 [Actinomycetota bacterium]|nr:hypothetical protein [Actinomycetota bacterium]